MYTNGSDFLNDMFLPSHWESQTRHQVASRSYRTMHTAGDSCPAWTLRGWATKPNMKKKNYLNLKLFLNNRSWSPCAILLQKSQHHTITLMCLKCMLGLGILQFGSPLYWSTIGYNEHFTPWPRPLTWALTDSVLYFSSWSCTAGRGSPSTQ